MSKISLKSSSSGTATFTIESPATNTDRTFNLPDAAGTLGLAGAAVARSQLPAGSVLQVVSATEDTNTITSSSSFVNTGLTASITPTSATSKIYVIATGGFDNNTAGNQGYATIVRNGTNLGNGTNGFNFLFSLRRVIVPWAAAVLDSPATTSSLTYTVQIRASSGTVEFPGGATRKTITLMEIAA